MHNPLLERPLSLYSNGQFIAGEGEDITVYDPSNATPITTLKAASAIQVEQAITAANKAFPAWCALGGPKRAEYLRRIAQALEQRRERLINVQMRNNGKPQFEADLDVSDAIATFNYYAEQAEQLETRQNTPFSLPDPYYQGQTRLEPVGAVGMIVPWNFPLVTSAWKIAPALAAGCTIVLKTSEYTPLAELVYADIAQEIELPQGVLNILTGAASTGIALTQSKKLAKLSFTGSNQVGSRVMQSAAERCQPVSLELGGKSAILVFKDAPVEQAVEQIVAGIFFNCGQMCSATSRLLVERSFAQQLIPALVERTRHLKVGSPFTEGVEMGPLSNLPQYQKVTRLLKQAQHDGLECLVGGEVNKSQTGWFVPPTIYDHIDRQHPFWREEIFGPVLVITYFDTEDEAIELANDSDYGLVATILSADLERAQRVANQIWAGHIWINSLQIIFPQTAWGGFKGSGIGRELGPWGLSAYLGVKHISIYDTQG
ncbi:aldehyde dehydrogenase family protein [Thiofilum flexile]|uniref:aldehyde dehydrogenase family protein n=1 Tax=Thiofilum flexile TaxID=125627 RepID=UPI00036D9E59|nr:aldehyde dehydrogenase family protein [Thiofilum flexile]